MNVYDELDIVDDPLADAAQPARDVLLPVTRHGLTITELVPDQSHLLIQITRGRLI